MPKYDLDLLITSSSRPQLFPYTMNSFNKYIHYRGNLKTIVHEDFVIPSESEKVVQYLEMLKSKNIVQEIYTHKPAIGLGRAMDEMIRSKVNCKYMFYLQEDWEFERPIDVDQILFTMDQNPEINLIYFNKINNSGAINGASQTPFVFSGLDVCLCHSWTFLPGIWRMDFVKKHWRMRADHPEGYFTNAFGNHETRMSDEYCIKNIGAYMLGKSGEPRYVRHLGNDWRMATWRMENGKPGGCHDASRMDYPYRAPWLPEMETRPVQNESYDKNIVDKMLSEEPKETWNV